MMKAFIVDRYKKTGVGRIGEFADPTLGADDVLVEVHAAGVNLLDSKIRNGEFKLFLPYRPPFVLGHDVAGVVVGVGALAGRRIGTRVVVAHTGSLFRFHGRRITKIGRAHV